MESLKGLVVIPTPKRLDPIVSTIEIEEDRLVDLNTKGAIVDPIGRGICAKRTSNEFANRALYLSNRYDWVLGRDPTGAIIVVPLKREEVNEWE